MGNLFNDNFGSTTPDNLFAGTTHPVDLKGITLKLGQGVLAKGTVLGQILLAVGAAVAGANTGNGTVTAISLGKKAKLGTYTLKCINAVANGGTFSVIGPAGERYTDASVGVAYSDGPLNFTINDGATDFVVGDSFTTAVGAGSEEYVKADSINADGSGEADCILADEVDTTLEAVVTTAYSSGEFNRKSLIFGGTDTADKHEATLRERGIFLKDVQTY